MSKRNLKVSLLPLILVGALFYLTANLLVWGMDQGGATATDAMGERPYSPNVPPLPFSPYGIVKGNGENAPPGAMVSAWCLSIQYAITGTIDFEGDTWYALDIPGDDPDTTGEKEGCEAGDTVDFQIDGYPADQDATWSSGKSEQVDLTYSYPTPSPTPTDIPTATPTTTPTPTATPVPSEGGKIYLPLIQSQ
jgi:hypothetical protein